jgi:RNA polymerase sigma-70 factor (ECF subfamily)
MFKKPFHDTLEDQEILERYYQDGDVEWLGILLPRFSMLLYGLCFKYLRNEEEARDAVQQVFIKAMSELPKYRVTYIKSWLYTVAKNHCLMKLRNTTGRTIELKESTTASAFENTDEEIKEKELRIEALEKALQGLNAEQRTCITLFYLQKKSYSQVSDETGYTMMQVKSHIQNGKRNLKILLSAANNEQ